VILANVRRRLGRDDAQLALRLVARGSDEELARSERTLRDDGMDALLDDPRLPDAMIGARQACNASLPLFSYVMVRHALRRLGEEDRTIADYVAAILIEFGMLHRAERIAGSDDQQYDTLAALLGDVDDGNPTRSFLVRAHLGNYALWMCGLFPDAIVAKQYRRGGPDLEYYEEMGVRGFELAASHRLAEQHGLVPLFKLAATRFALLRIALNRVSDTLLFPNHHSPDRLLRQVSDEMRWRKVG
jgi:hypothetical protein